MVKVYFQVWIHLPPTIHISSLTMWNFSNPIAKRSRIYNICIILLFLLLYTESITCVVSFSMIYRLISFIVMCLDCSFNILTAKGALQCTMSPQRVWFRRIGKNLVSMVELRWSFKSTLFMALWQSSVDIIKHSNFFSSLHSRPGDFGIKLYIWTYNFH